MRLDDHQMNVAGLGVDETTGFLLKQQPSRSIPYKNNWQNSITFEMSMDRRDYFRNVYSILDFVSDLGGLYGAISPICVISLVILNFWSGYQFLMSDLFVGGVSTPRHQKRLSGSQVDKQKEYSQESDNVQCNCCKSLYISMVTMCAKPGSKNYCFCRPSRAKRLRSKGLRFLLNELSISHIIRQLRVLNAATKKKFSELEWQELQ